MERIRLKITHVVGHMRPALKCEWGMRRRTVRMVCKGLFVTYVMYGSSAWCECMMMKYACAIIDRTQMIVWYACLQNRIDGCDAGINGCNAL